MRSRSRRKRAVLLVALLVAAAPAALSARESGSAPEDAAGGAERARRILREAFERRYGADLAARVELLLRDARGRERRRVFRTLTAHREGRMYALGRLVEPPALRGMALLTVEAPERSDDAFVYLPALGRVRRVGASRRDDAFLGSDLTYADFERHRVGDYRVEGVRETRLQGEAAWWVRAGPRRPGRFARVDFGVARADHALLSIRYYREGRESPARRLRAPREAIVRRGRWLLPTRIEVRSPARGTATFVHVRELDVEPELREGVFSVLTLESELSLEAALRENGRALLPASPDANDRPRAPRTGEDEELR